MRSTGKGRSEELRCVFALRPEDADLYLTVSRYQSLREKFNLGFSLRKQDLQGGTRDVLENYIYLAVPFFPFFLF